jgi:PIN domain nuclease of toxin-antitoxin system
LLIAGDAAALSPRARMLFRDPGNEVYLSAVSGWEIAVKHGLGRLVLPTAPDRFVPEQREAHGIVPLALDEESVLQVTRLPDLHRDPFDRMLVCQAIAHGLVILTPDPLIARYPVRTVW